MTNTNQNTESVASHTTAAEHLAEAVMKAAGSSLRHYMPSSKAKIIAACQAGIDGARSSQLETDARVLDALENLVIGIGMGWDLEGMIEKAQAAIAEATGRLRDGSPTTERNRI